MPHRRLEPAAVSRLAFQSDAVPNELLSPSFYPAIKTVVSLPAPWSLFVTALGGLNKSSSVATGGLSTDRPLFSPFLLTVSGQAIVLSVLTYSYRPPRLASYRGYT